MINVFLICTPRAVAPTYVGHAMSVGMYSTDDYHIFYRARRIASHSCAATSDQ